jgi:hypothetical protein
MEHEKTRSSVDDRREFLKKCGKFAAITPPVVTTLLSTALTSDAIAKSSASKGLKLGWSKNGKK